MTKARQAETPASKLNLIIGTVVGFLVIASALVNYGKQSAVVDQVNQKVDAKVTELSGKVEAASKEAQSKVNELSSEVKGSNALLQTKQDQLTKDFAQNQTEQQSFRTDTRNLFGKLFDAQQALKDQINAERLDRITEAAKKK